MVFIGLLVYKKLIMFILLVNIYPQNFCMGQ